MKPDMPAVLILVHNIKAGGATRSQIHKKQNVCLKGLFLNKECTFKGTVLE